MPPEGKKNVSPDYPQLVRGFLETSGDAATCKLPAGLYVVATPIGHLGDITLRALITLLNADRIACEDTRTSGGMLAKYGIKKPLLPYHDHNARGAGEKILSHIQDGEAIALISDAGMPLISDPGFTLVREAKERGFAVTVIPGANAVITALAGAGLPSDQFHFAGFLPPKEKARQKAITELARVPGTLLLHEAPQRLGDCMADLAAILGATRQAAVARELTKLFEETRRGTLGELAEFYASNEPKGEIVILVAPSVENAEDRRADVEKLLREALKTQSIRDAVSEVSAVTGARKKDVYELALKLSGKE